VAVDIQLAQLRAFHSVSRLASYALAAEELSYSEPAVYLQVKRLEKSLGLRLVRRQRKQVMLTAEGAEFLPHVVELLERADALTQAARGLQGRIVIASGPNTAVSWIMPIVSRYQMEFPGHEVELHAGDAAQLVRDVIYGNVDIAIGGMRRNGIRPETMRTHRLVLVPWVEDRWAVFGSPGLIERVRRRELAPPLRVYHYPRFTPLPLAEAQQYITDELGIPVVLVETDTLELVRGAIVNDLGLGIVPESAGMFLAAERVVPVCGLGPYGTLTLRLLHRRPRLLAPAVQQMLGYLIRARADATVRQQPSLPARLRKAGGA
jgi:DNA-binding transcriptional LysR family regulator